MGIERHHGGSDPRRTTIESRQSARVRVWFGDTPICTVYTEPAKVGRCAAAMRRRFAGLVVTIDDRVGSEWSR